MVGHIEERSNTRRDTEEEGRSRGVIENTTDDVQAKLCGGRAGLKVSNNVTINNLCVDRVEEGVWVADPGIIARDTAVCGRDDDDDD